MKTYEKTIYENISKRETRCMSYGIAECGHRFFIKTIYPSEAFSGNNKDKIEEINKLNIIEYSGKCPLCYGKYAKVKP